VGLKRNGISEENVRMASELFKILYLRNLRTEKAVEEIEERFGVSPFAQTFIRFIKETKVGIQR
jgi:acyl-[acyl carrier protein]--UDP-N-acetylglucosamine O-acyltransferase